MISIIICSINPERCEKTLENFSKTIGIEYEVIVFDNRQKGWGLCKTYNYCAEKAKYQYLCFVHEDVFIDTKDWGKRIVEFVEKIPKCGVVGFAGGLQARKNFSSWWAGERRVNIRDGYNSRTRVYSRADYRNHAFINPDNEPHSRVLCVDGLFHFVKKTIWEEVKYDESTFPAFHFYDVDFSLAVSELYSNYALLNFDVFHDSSGNVNKEYIKWMFAFQEKWNGKLPKSITAIDGFKNLYAELREAMTVFVYCKIAGFAMGKYLRQIQRINSVCFFVLVLVFLPLKVLRTRLTQDRSVRYFDVLTVDNKG